MHTDTLTKRERITGQEFRQIVNAVQKTLSVEIAAADLETLKGAGYKLCFAKKVGDNDFNVVWQSYDQYLINNSFSWTPMYQLFGSNSFIANVKVQVSTNIQDIGLGEECTLNSAGVLQPAVSSDYPEGFQLINDYGSIHPGVNQLSIGITGQQISTPIYVASNPVVLGSTKLTPVEKVLVWFEQNIQTSTMFSDSRSDSYEIDLTNANQKTIKYENQKWSTIG